MARLVFGMNQSLDGYVDHTAFGPSPVLFRHFVDEARGQAGSIYGRRMYEIMRYWDDDQPGWSDDERAFADAWRRMPKWVVSHANPPLGPNATLVGTDLAASIQWIKTSVDGEIEVAGTQVARSLIDLGLIDEYRIYLHPVVLGTGTPYFTARPSALRLVSSDRIDEQVVRLVYVPA